MQPGRTEERVDPAEIPLRRVIDLLRNPAAVWPTFRAYLGFGKQRRLERIADMAGLQNFMETRASFVAQTSLYGYLRTRAGQRYPELFDDLGFVASVNVAKWQIWLACLSDLAIYAGGLLARAAPESRPSVGPAMLAAVDAILARTGIPGDAGPEFAASAADVLERLRQCDWPAVGDNETAFSQSPPALVRWAPIVDSLKALDEPIVLNSVRFRWQEVRRDLRRCLDAAAIF
ncbi:hypothetical protein [Dongia sp.]|uniref:hypothetical protein n=1 Tax=Dongia sp. TaxID=1977262 RepID=UPI0035B4CBC5